MSQKLPLLPILIALLSTLAKPSFSANYASNDSLCRGPNLWYNGTFEVTTNLLASGWNTFCFPPFYQVITSQTPGFLYPDITDHTPFGNGNFLWSDHSQTPCVFFPIGSDVTTLSQKIATIPGEKYRFGVWVYSFCLGLGGEFGLAVDGTILLETDLNAIPNCSPGWIYYSVEWVAVGTITDFTLVDVNWHLFGWDMAFDDLEVYQLVDFQVDVSADTSVCAGNCAQLFVSPKKGGSIATVNWSPGNSLSDPATYQPFACPDSTTQFMVIAADSLGCPDTQKVEIAIRSLPNVDLGPDLLVCDNECTQVSVSQQFSNPDFLWSDGSSGNSTLVCVNSSPQTIWLSVTENGCTGFDTLNLSPTPIPAVFVDSARCSPDLQTFNVWLFTQDVDTILVSEGLVVNTGSGFFQIRQIPKGNTLIINVLSDNDCSVGQLVASPDCSCPNIPAPQNDGNKNICEGDALPVLSVVPGVNLLVDWFDTPIGGSLLLQNSTIFLPTGAGTFYAETYDPISNCRSATRTAVSLYIRPLPAANAGQDQTICSAGCAELTASGGTIYNWNSGENIGTVTACPSQSTTYVVTVTDAFGCKGLDSVEVFVEPAPAIFPGEKICNDSLTAWNLDFQISIPNPMHVSASLGNLTGSGTTWQISGLSVLNSVTISVQSASNTCDTMLVVSPPVCPCPPVDAPTTSGETKICEGQSLPELTASAATGMLIHWYSTSSGGNPILGNSASFAVSTAGTWFAEAQNPVNGCVSNSRTAATLTVFPLPKISLPGSAVIACGQHSIILDASNSDGGAGFDVFWEMPIGQSQVFPSGNFLMPEIETPGRYALKINDLQTGCEKTDSVFVLKTEPPTAEILVGNPLCPGEKGLVSVVSTLGGLSPLRFSADGGMTFSNDLNFENLSPGNWIFIVEDASGCQSETQFEIEEPDSFSVSIKAVEEISIGESLMLSPQVSPISTVFDTIFWSPALGLECPTCLQTVAKPEENTVYVLTLQDENGCEKQVSVQVLVDQTLRVYFPTAIQPESQRTENEAFTIFANPTLIQKVADLKIWDRWGELVFDKQNFPANDLSAGWNGKFRGKFAPQGVYVWRAKIVLTDGSEIYRRGEVSVVR